MHRPRITTGRLMLIVATLAIPYAAIAWFIRGPETAGAMDAEQDIAAGTLQFKTYGMQLTDSNNAYKDLLKNRLGVKTTAVAGCVVNDDLVRNVNAYNTRVAQEIASRYGPNALNQVLADATKAPP